MKNIIALPGWGFSSESFKELLQNAQIDLSDNLSSDLGSLTVIDCETLFKDKSRQPKEVIKNHIEQLNDKPLSIIAWSLGALIALDYCINFQDHETQLILLSPTSNFNFKNEQNLSELKALKLDLTKDRDKALKRFYIKLIAPTKPSRTESIKQCLAYQTAALSLSTDSLVEALSYLELTNLSNDLNKLRNPCLLIHGESDNLIPHHHAVLINNELTNSKLVLLQTASHLLPYNHKFEILESIQNHDFSIN